MNILDEVYTLFDTIARKHNVYKIGTVGDAYTAVRVYVSTLMGNSNWVVLFLDRFRA